VCYACSAVHLSFSLQDISFGEEKNKTSVWTFIDKLQDVLNSDDNTEGSLPPVPRRVEQGLAQVGLKIHGVSSPIQAPFTAVGSYVTRMPGHYFILLGNHCCSAIHKENGQVLFFDPNYGQAKFGTSFKATAAISSFLSDLKIMENYGMADGEPALVVRVGL
ncbi:MAG TPA: hypothetical protein VFO41_08730, partial [Alphaproteobacteria bacterium]|nr:hypothetical protein [Alphaproteobacteria bacterium]